MLTCWGAATCGIDDGGDGGAGGGSRSGHGQDSGVGTARDM